MGLRSSRSKEAEASWNSSSNDIKAPPPYMSVPTLSSSAPSQQYGSAEYGNTAPTPRTFHLYQEGPTRRRKKILMENDKTTKAYDVQSHTFSKPQVRITSGSATEQEVGVVNIHYFRFSTSLDLMVNGKAIKLDGAGFFTRTYSFMSSIGNLRWEPVSVWKGGRACVTEKGEWLARFDRRCCLVKKEGKLEIVNSQLPQGLVDELVVSGLAMVEMQRRKNGGSAPGGSNAGAC